MMYERVGGTGGGTFRGGRAGIGYTERGDNNMNHCQCQISLGSGGGDHRGERACVCARSRDSRAVNRQPLRRHYVIYTYIR